ncbi:hypothetical protein H4219_002522 [Mycoemilia scoparia]|uniref:Amino acid transporter transmembrane domain-containing protein n=1 Tax=Mycoemilia scoparia TaxID=417184 RepID=A0A9W7ZXF4_9FUNG|nr:hypothetical protein H4219_002522 [Mycoemilia scoparia]
MASEELILKRTSINSVDTSKSGESQPLSTTQTAPHPSKRTGTWMGASLNIICVSVGTGVLNLPSVINRSGWSGLGIMVLMAIIGVYVGNIFVQTMYIKPGKRLESFAFVTQEAFGRKGFWFSTAITVVYCLGTVCTWIIITGTQTTHLLGEAHKHLDQRASMAIVAVCMWIPYVSLKEIREITISSVFGVLTALATAIIVVCASFANRDSSAAHTGVAVGGLPTALASISFMYAGAVVYPHIEGNMKHPKQWCVTLGLSNFVVCTIFCLVSGVGYWAFGSHTVSPVVDNLPHTTAVNAGIVLIILHVIFAAPLMLVSATLEIEMALGITKEKMGTVREMAWRLVIRTLAISGLLGISIAIPYFGETLDLISSISTTVVFFLVPVACHIKLLGWRNAGLTKLVACGAIFLLGIVACGLGTFNAVKALVASVRNGSKG